MSNDFDKNCWHLIKNDAYLLIIKRDKPTKLEATHLEKTATNHPSRDEAILELIETLKKELSSDAMLKVIVERNQLAGGG